MPADTVFGVVDYVVFGSTLLLSALVGIYFYFTGGKQKTTGEFLLGNKEMSAIPVALSMMTSFWAAAGVLGVTSETYLYGIILIYQIIPYFLSIPIVIYVYHNVFYSLGLTTVNQYLMRRFGKYASGTATISFMIQIILYLPVVLFAPALTLSTVTGISLWATILSVGLVCTFYCTVGGVKAVIWTDLFQAFLMFSAILVVIVKGCLDVGGFRKMWAIAANGGRINAPSFKFDPTERYGFWALAIGGTFTNLTVNGASQIQVQRMLSVGSIKKSRQAIYVTQLSMTVFVICLCLCGIVMYANMGSCDPLLRSNETGMTSSDQLLPYYIMQSVGSYPGLPGLCVSGLFSASISTISSGLNSLAAVTLEDFIKPYFCVGQMTESKAVLIAKILVLSYGLICIILSYFVQNLGVLMQATVTVLSAFGSPLLGLFTLGMLFIRPNEKGAIVGHIVSTVFFLWIGFGSNLSHFYPEMLPQTVDGCLNVSIPANASINITLDKTADEESGVFLLYKISYFWAAAFGFLMTVVLGYLVSILTGPNTTVEEDLLAPMARWLHGHSKNQDEPATMEFKHKDSDLVRADARNKVSCVPDTMTELRMLREEMGIKN